MDNVVEYNRRGAITHASVGSGGGGGGVDDIYKRLGNVETQISAISATIPYLATAASVSEVKSQIAAILAVIPHLATKAEFGDLKAAIVQVKADMASMETKIIKWIIATVLASFTLAFSIAKFVH